MMSSMIFVSEAYESCQAYEASEAFEASESYKTFEAYEAGEAYETRDAYISCEVSLPFEALFQHVKNLKYINQACKTCESYEAN